jgi:hypothetical protein
MVYDQGIKGVFMRSNMWNIKCDFYLMLINE